LDAEDKPYEYECRQGFGYCQNNYNHKGKSTYQWKHNDQDYASVPKTQIDRSII